MAKRRTVIDSDNEQSQEGSSSGVKRPRLDVAEVEDQPQHRSSKSKSKGKGKAKDDNDILNDIRVDDDDDIATVRDTQVEEDEGAQERFEEEHEESIRESIRQKNRHQGVGFGLPLACLIYAKSCFDRVSQNSASLRPLRCTSSCVTSTLPSNLVLR
jgi:hypothetical protein